MNTSLLAGLGVGSGVVILGLVAASLVAPPPERHTGPVPQAETQDTAPDAEDTAIPERADAEPAGTADSLEPDQIPETLSDAPQTSGPADIPDAPAETADLSPDPTPTVPPQEPEADHMRLPSSIVLERGPDGDMTAGPAPTPPAPAEEAGLAEAPVTDDLQMSEQSEDAEPAPEPEPPGLGLPQIGTDADLPDAGATHLTALERNALFEGDRSGPRMALILSDPGLPMAMRRALAALDFPFTVALNPMDTTAADAAAIYREDGKEVLILGTSIPDGATASDLDVTFSAFFEALPMAVGVIDLPQGGFARNARLLNEVLPILRDDGHGLITFSGGLSQATRAAEAAEVAHAEVFRVIDSGNESAFTMRRFLDRAIFQASQMGHVVVYGDASNEIFMEAVEMWRTGRMLDQVTLVPISGVLLSPD